MFKFSFDDLFFRVVNRSTFTCPYCYQSNLDNKGLLQHVNNNHKTEQQSVVSELFDVWCMRRNEDTVLFENRKEIF